MAATVTPAVREFMVLNRRFATNGLTGADQARWGLLAHALDGALARQRARSVVAREARLTTRAVVQLPVRFLCGARVGVGRTHDLSCGGCSVETACELPVGANVELTVWLPGRLGAVHPVGEVCWSARQALGWHAGIAFSSLPQWERAPIASFVLGSVLPRVVPQA